MYAIKFFNHNSLPFKGQPVSYNLYLTTENLFVDSTKLINCLLEKS